MKHAVALLANSTTVASSGTAPGIVLETAKVISLHSYLNIYGELVIVTGIVAGGLIPWNAVA